MNQQLLNIFAIIFLLCMIASGSYASIGGLILGILILEALDKRLSFRFLLTVGIAMSISYVVLEPLISARAAYQSPTNGIIPQTLAFRFVVWREVFIPVLKLNWLWGVQPIIPPTSTWAWAENNYLGLFYRGGVIAFSAHIAWITGTFIWLLHIFRKKTGIVRSLAAISLVMFINLSIMAMTNEVFTYSGVMDYLWIFLGLAASDERVYPEQDA